MSFVWSDVIYDGILDQPTDILSATETRVNIACRVTIVSHIRFSDGCIPFWVDFE